MQYLLGRLTGHALDLSKGILPTGDNYSLLWSALCDKYNDKRSLAVSYFNQLLKLPVINTATPAALEGFVDKYSTLVSALKQIDITNLAEFMFVHLGLRSLDLETVKCFEMHIRENKEFPTSSELIKFIRDQYRVLSRTNVNNIVKFSSSQNNNNTNSYKTRAATQNKTFKTFVNIQSRYDSPSPYAFNETKSLKCNCCNVDKHQLYQCPKFTSLNPFERYTYAKINKLCFNCLSHRHSIVDCNSIKRCRFCSRNHHSLIHFSDSTKQAFANTMTHAEGHNNNLNTPAKPNHNRNDKHIALFSRSPAAAARYNSSLPRASAGAYSHAPRIEARNSPSYSPAYENSAPRINTCNNAPSYSPAYENSAPRINTCNNAPSYSPAYENSAPRINTCNNAPSYSPAYENSPPRVSTRSNSLSLGLRPPAYPPAPASYEEHAPHAYAQTAHIADAPAHFPPARTSKSEDVQQINFASARDNQNISLCVTNTHSEVIDPSRNIYNNCQTVLLGTAVCYAQQFDTKKLIPIRVLIDSGSMKDIITRECCDRLNLPLFSAQNAQVSGLGDVVNNPCGLTNLKLISRLNDKVRFDLQPYVVDRITSELPSCKVDISSLSYLKDLPLADNYYYQPGTIDMILGCEVFARILLQRKFSRGSNEPIAIETTLGFLILGKAQTASTDDRAQTFFCNFNCTFENCISRFFDTEELPSDNYLTPAEQECENIFEQTTSRDSNGRYSVALPFKADPASLGESRHIAERRFLSLERRLSVNPLVKREYDKIINEYIEKGYITIVNNNTLNSNQYYVIPHHAVVRGDKLTTKVRMVLNASMKTSSGISLNDILHTGRNLQSDLFRIILNFRLFPVAVSADIRQMFLQVTVKESFRQYQRILYRFNSNEPIQLYQFNRVTFGMTCSPYLAMRVIRQLMNDERSRFPVAVAALEKDAIYTDDVALSFRNTAEAITASKQLIDLFAAGGFDLVKFAIVRFLQRREVYYETERVFASVKVKMLLEDSGS
ncbi:uncharacterized protein LOC121734457 [Aricia agestis]|uniref:uncharacterized protein LOC121734457 n=1 Tax=Aricia agestis TaxID=91739 RepID=UPI001C202A87|nr:uncharacterized protein LOC121734457 [Aricia agestis]